MIRKPWIGTFATVLLLCAVSRPGTARGEAPGVPFIPKEAKALASRGEKVFAGGHLKEARVLYKEALDFGPSNPRVLVSLAAVETRMGNLPESERLLRQALSLDLRNGAAWLLLGMNQLELKRDEEAFASLVQAALHDPQNPRAHNYLGIASGRKEWTEASELELRRAVELDPAYADANFNLAVLYLRRTPPLLELAKRHYRKALDLGSPKDPSVEALFAKDVATAGTASAASAASQPFSRNTTSP